MTAKLKFAVAGILAANMVGGCVIARALPGPTTSLSSVVTQSDTIVVGELQDIELSSPEMHSINGNQVEARVATAHLKVYQKIKGPDLDASVFTVTYLVSTHYIGTQTEATDRLRVFFLKRQDDGFGFSNPYLTSLPAMMIDGSKGSDPASMICAIEAGVLQKKSSGNSDKIDAINGLSTLKEDCAAEVMRHSLESEDVAVAANAATRLTLRGDRFGLSKSMSLLHSEKDLAAFDRTNLILGIRNGQFKETDLDLLQGAAGEPDVMVRRAAIAAIMTTNSRSMLPALVAALDDSDEEVRFLAVAGLAKFTGDHEHHPSMPEFSRNGSKYISYWKLRAPNL